MNPLSRLASAVGLTAAPPPVPAIPAAGIYPPESLASSGQAVWEGDEAEASTVPIQDISAAAPGSAFPGPSGSGSSGGQPLPIADRIVDVIDAIERRNAGIPPGPIGALGKPDLWPELLTRLGDLPARFKAACQEFRRQSHAMQGYTVAGRSAFIREGYARLNNAKTPAEFQAIALEIAAVGDDTRKPFMEQASARYLQERFRELFPPLLLEFEALGVGAIAELRSEAIAREAEASYTTRELTGHDLTGRPLTAKVNALEAAVARLLTQARGELECGPREVPGLYFEELFA